jgi:hypothetical protein
MNSVPTMGARIGSAIGLMFAVGCSDSSQPDTSPPPSSSPSSPAASPTSMPGLDWTSDRTNILTPGWTAGPCPGGGDAPLRCVRHGGRLAAQMEFLKYPTKTITNSVGHAVAIARGVARSSYKSFRTDRLTACGKDVTVDPLVTSLQRVLGHDGVRYEFRLRKHGQIDELVVGWVTVADKSLQLVVTAGYADGACLPPEGPSVAPDELDARHDVLNAAVAAAMPPA